MPPIPTLPHYPTGVYCLRNTVNGKRYVGSSSRSVTGRLQDHRRCLRAGTHNNRHLQNAWNKYGEDAFAFEVLLRCKPENCVRWEQWCINYHKSADRHHGYNIAPQAGSTLGYKMPPDVLAVVTANNRRTKADPVVRQKIAASTKANWDDPAKRPTMEQANRDRVTPEFREKRSRQMKEAFTDPSYKARHAQAMKDRFVKDPTLRQRLSDAKRGRKSTPEAVAARKAALARPEVREKMRQSRMRYLARKRAENGLEQ